GPGWVNALACDGGHAGPAALFSGNSNRIADGLAGTGHEVQVPITEADDNLTLLELRAEAHVLAAAAADHGASAPIPEQLRRSGSRAEAHRRHDGPQPDARIAQQACDDHRSKLPLRSFLSFCLFCPTHSPVPKHSALRQCRPVRLLPILLSGAP